MKVKRLFILGVAALLGGCSPVTGAFGEALGSGHAPAAQASAPEPEPEPPPPASPAEAAPGPKGDLDTWRRALDTDDQRIVVSRESRRLWLMEGDSVLLSAPVAVGREEIFVYEGQEWDFSTPAGRMVVQDKETTPEWVPPDWHYFEQAVERDYEPVQLKWNDRVELSDSTVIEVREGDVGRINRFGHWRAFDPGREIMFDEKVFIPPFGSPQRRIPDILGTHRLILGDGYLIHGTPETDSIGEYASHGCVRMFNRDVATLYDRVDPGVPVYIY